MHGPQGIQTAGYQIEMAVSILRQGGVVAFPTDTLYALGAHVFMEQAVRRVFQVKGRPHEMALPLLLARVADMERVASHIPKAAWAMAGRFWPGALTLILPKAPSISPLITGGRETVAVRVPNHPLALELIASAGAPLTGTSANRHGGADPVTAEEARQQLGEGLDMVIDGGACPLKGASTMLDMTGDIPRVIRAGVIPATALAQVCPEMEEASSESTVG